MAFNSEAYLAANPDVAAAVAAGAFGGDAYQHYVQYGQSEGRSPSGEPAAAQPNWSSGAGYAKNITAAPGTPGYFGQLNDAWAAYRAGSGVNPITGKTSADESGTWWNPGTIDARAGSYGNYMMQPDIAMNYMVNRMAEKGVTPEQYALSHIDYSVSNGDSGRGGILPTGQTTVERLAGLAGGTMYNIFGYGDGENGKNKNPALLDPIRGINASPEAMARYKQVFGNDYGNVGVFTNLDPDKRMAYGPQFAAQFTNLGKGGAVNATQQAGGSARPPSTAGGLLSTAGLPSGGSMNAGASAGASQPSISYTATSTSAPAPQQDVAKVESGIASLLATDANGAYVNQVVRQASDRALQAFAGRGLLNSSMAQQASQEAAIAKAVEIATTDANAINAANKAALDRLHQSSENTAAFERELAKLAAASGYDIAKLREQYGLDGGKEAANQEWNLQSAYRTSRQQIDLNYSNEINNINASGMTPEQKADAARNAAATRDAGLASVNEMYSRAPGWKNEWAAVAVSTNVSGIATITSIPTLTAIVNDPAQSQAMKDAAAARIAELNKPKPAGLIASTADKATQQEF